jgi:hypothetical protein
MAGLSIDKNNRMANDELRVRRGTVLIENYNTTILILL